MIRTGTFITALLFIFSATSLKAVDLNKGLILLDTSVSLTNLQYISGQNVGDKIEIPVGGSARVQFGVALQNSSGQPGTLKVYTKKCSSCTLVNRGSWSVFNGEDFKEVSVDITLNSNAFDQNRTGYLFGRFEKSGGLNYNSRSKPIVIDNGGGGSDGTSSITNNSISSSQTVLLGRLPKQINGSLPKGGNGSFRYKWEYNDDGYWVTLSGVNTRNYQPEAITKTTSYRRKVTSGDATSFSGIVKLTVLVPPGKNLSPLARVKHSLCPFYFPNYPQPINWACGNKDRANDLVVSPYVPAKIPTNNGWIEFAWSVPIQTSLIAWEFKQGGTPKDFTYQYYDNSLNQWKEIRRIQGARNQFGLTQIEPIVTEKVRILVSQGSDVNPDLSPLLELYVYGDFLSENKALSAQPSASSRFMNLGDFYHPDSAIDGNSSMEANPFILWASSYMLSGSSQWYELSWETTQTVSQVNIYSPYSGNESYDIQYWASGSWITVDSNSSVSGVQAHNFPTVSTKRLRIVFNQGYTHPANGFQSAYLSEIEVY